ncbi:MAG: aldehyde dehydrogenase family protein [Herbaspirillum sp.]|uniref:aldehyde dehydrogenase family protein n=1 Tax=Herbaspirillum sp. TaxID=1890675 RepID=UPI002584ED39|nr:aldehyde dehydrogenase family protein [Herbaspirillum sp.]MCP3656961.1 aldehyde dehydrogenase family protein [Herbaspirillum sp.]MCP3949024.1 aldehyde dehydrogenase family protein [Herbaspirillum sp.]MCP4030446.1 aldehyde dehydrogenase family protein [Herbaspirillum sp.]MCP4557798.1 aldehyde dehydrogenase family protein [Herbaspirillum sp.]
MSDKSAISLEMLINNEDVSTVDYFEVRDPGRLTEIVGKVAIGAAGHVHDAVSAAHAAYQSWKAVPVRGRIESLLSAADEMEGMAADLANLLVREQGMLLRETTRGLLVFSAISDGTKS